ncbi:15568_t:CDS:1, partial [Dentiscutata erythropus]
IRQYAEECTDFISTVLFAYRTTQHHTTWYKPFFLVYGRNMLLPIETVITSYPVEPTTEDELQDCLSWRIDSILGTLESAQNQAQENI